MLVTILDDSGHREPIIGFDSERSFGLLCSARVKAVI